jgi:hypothetical protein
MIERKLLGKILIKLVVNLFEREKEIQDLGV